MCTDLGGGGVEGKGIVVSGGRGMVESGGRGMVWSGGSGMSSVGSAGRWRGGGGLDGSGIGLASCGGVVARGTGMSMQSPFVTSGDELLLFASSSPLLRLQQPHNTQEVKHLLLSLF